MMSLAEAGGFLNSIQSATSGGVAGAGSTALGEDAATIWYNPAGMILLSRPEALIASGFSFPSVTFKNNGSTDGLGFPVGGNERTNPPVSVLPSAFASLPVNDGLRLGLGLLVPFGET